MDHSDRLPLFAVALATVLALALALAAGGETAGADAAVDVGDGRQGLALVAPGDVTRLVGGVMASTTTTPPTTSTTTTTTTAPVPAAPPTSAPAPAAPREAPPTTLAATPATTPPPPPPPPPPAEPTPSGSCAANFGSWINSYRSSNGVAPLTVDGGIAHVPLDWSMSMARNQSLGHNPNYAGQIRASRPNAGSIGENVGYNSSGDRAVFDNMVSSGSHRAAFLNGAFTHGATGCAVDGQGKVWVTVDFWG